MASIKPIDVMALSVVLNGETMTLGEAVGKLREMVSPKHHAAVADERDARIAELEAECERLRGGPPGPYENCTDCERPMVWSHADTVSPVWMCPRCTLVRARNAEAALAAGDGR